MQRTEAADAGVRFTNSGRIPPVEQGFADAGVSASDRAFGDPDIEWLARTYDPKQPKPDVKYVAREIRNRNREKLLEWIRTNVEDGYAEANAVQIAIEDLDNDAIHKRDASKQPSFKNGQWNFGEQSPTVTIPTPRFGTSDSFDTPHNQDRARQQRDEERALTRPDDTHTKDEKHDPMSKELERLQNGNKPKEEEAIEAQLTDPNNRRHGVRKTHP